MLGVALGLGRARESYDCAAGGPCEVRRIVSTFPLDGSVRSTYSVWALASSVRLDVTRDVAPVWGPCRLPAERLPVRRRECVKKAAASRGGRGEAEDSDREAWMRVGGGENAETSSASSLGQ